MKNIFESLRETTNCMLETIQTETSSFSETINSLVTTLSTEAKETANNVVNSVQTEADKDSHTLHSMFETTSTPSHSVVQTLTNFFTLSTESCPKTAESVEPIDEWVIVDNVDLDRSVAAIKQKYSSNSSKTSA